jgi:uncharacterized protein YggE
MKILKTLFAIVFLHQLSANAQVMGNYWYNNKQTDPGRNTISRVNDINDNAVTLSVNGLMNMVADRYIAVFNIVQVGDNAETANNLMGERINRFIVQLKKNGVDTSDIKIDMISFVPKYELKEEDPIFSKTFNEVPAGFELQKNVRVGYYKSAKLDLIVNAAAAVEIFDLVKVDYFVKDMEKQYAVLRDKCIQALKAKTKSYELIGFKLDTCHKTMGEDYRSVYPPERYFSYQSLSRPNMDAAKRKNLLGISNKINQVQVPNSKFYGQVNSNDYDLVLNPDIPEPAVQFSYSITVKYQVKEEAKPKNQYFIITTQGDVKQVFVK